MKKVLLFLLIVALAASVAWAGRTRTRGGVLFDDANITTSTITTLTATSADINGGTIDATTVGATTASTGAFSTLEASTSLAVPSTLTVTTTNAAVSNLTATTVDINGGAIDGATLGGASQVTITDAIITAAEFTSFTTTVSEKTASYSVVAGDSGKTFTNEGSSGTVEFDLPEAAVGLQYCFASVDSGDYTITVDPEASDQILGLCNAAGDAAEAQLDEDDTPIGHTMCLRAVDEVYWIIVGSYGVNWVDAN
jgi:hypothetical protein